MKSLVFCVFVLLLSGCTGTSLSNRETGAIGGAALGSGLGAIVGNQVGNTGAGIAIGAAAGALTGGLIGNEQDSHSEKVATQEEILRRQEEEIQRQKRELEDLQRQEYHNDSFRKYDSGGSTSEMVPLDQGNGPNNGAPADDSFKY